MLGSRRSDRFGRDTTERVMTQTINVRRHTDGELNFDFYRERARALRSQAIRDATVLRWGVGGLVALATLGLLATVPQPSLQVARIAPPPVACIHSASDATAATRCY
jgi:hypothetical protein